MRRIALSILVLCLFGASLTQTTPAAPVPFTPAELLAAVNYARTQPKLFAEEVKKITNYFANGVWQKDYWEENCYLNAYNWLLNEAPAGLRPFIGSPTNIIAAIRHNRWIAESNHQLSHSGADGSWPWVRLKRVGVFIGCWRANENIAQSWRHYASANAYVFQWIADCGIASRGHRLNIYDAAITHYGCAEHQDTVNRDNWYSTCVGSTAMTLNDAVRSDPDFAAAGLA